MSFLNPDIALDYRADNRLWLRAAAVLANRRPYRNFFLLAVEDQFIYYLLKKVIKGAVEASHVVQLRNLYRANPFACRERILRFWGGNSACGIERALIHLDLSWLVSQLPELLQKLRKSDPVETIPERVSNRLRDLWRIAKRILYPTGMSVEISGADQQQCSEIAGALLEALAPAFRHVCNWDEDSSAEGISNERGVNRRRLSNISNVIARGLRLRTVRTRSTLVVTTLDLERDGSPVAQASFGNRFLFADLSFVLTPAEGLVRDGSRQNRQVIVLNSDLPFEQIVQEAVGDVLAWLSARQASRLRKSGASQDGRVKAAKSFLDTGPDTFGAMEGD